jgi:hypothetical protein
VTFKPKRKKEIKTWELIYWDCGNPEHRHKLKKRAAECHKKALRPSPTFKELQRKRKNRNGKIWNDYKWREQSFKELAAKHNLSESWVRAVCLKQDRVYESFNRKTGE